MHPVVIYILVGIAVFVVFLRPVSRGMEIPSDDAEFPLVMILCLMLGALWPLAFPVYLIQFLCRWHVARGEYNGDTPWV